MGKSARRRTAPAKKLTKAERRKQLLETAHEIVRDEGTDALTLGYLAERAGVTKPIAYEHFETRAGLLVALYQEIDDRQVASLMDALKRTKPRLERCRARARQGLSSIATARSGRNGTRSPPRSRATRRWKRSSNR